MGGLAMRRWLVLGVVVWVAVVAVGGVIFAVTRPAEPALAPPLPHERPSQR